MYEYQCSTCGKVFELIQKYSDAPLAVHEECGGKLEKLVSAPALQFKGSGWYVNDYATAASKADRKSGESNGEVKGDGKTDAKKDAKSDSATAPNEAKETKPAASGAKSESKPATTPAPTKTD